MASAAQRPTARTGADKVVLLLLALDTGKAKDLLKRFEQDEIALLMRAAEQLSSATGDELAALVEDFAAAFADGGAALGAPSRVRSLFEGHAPEDPAMAGTQTEAPARVPVWPQLARLKHESLRDYLAREHPQTAAFVLLRLGSEFAAEVVKGYAPEVRNELLARMLGLRKVQPRVVEALEDVLHEDLIEAASGGAGQHSALAGVLNSLDQMQSSEALAHLASVRPKDAQLVRKMLFKFDDLVRLPSSALTRLMDGVPVERVVLALQGMDVAFQGVVLATMAPRARRMAESELQSGAAAPARDIAEARRQIAEAVLRLAAAGAIELGEPAGEAP